jgi:hypothetical protein
MKWISLIFVLLVFKCELFDPNKKENLEKKCKKDIPINSFLLYQLSNDSCKNPNSSSRKNISYEECINKISINSVLFTSSAIYQACIDPVVR